MRSRVTGCAIALALSFGLVAGAFVTIVQHIETGMRSDYGRTRD